MTSCGSGNPWRAAMAAAAHGELRWQWRPMANRSGRSKASETDHQKGMLSTSALRRWYTDIADIVSERYASDAQMRASLPEETRPAGSSTCRERAHNGLAGFRAKARSPAHRDCRVPRVRMKATAPQRPREGRRCLPQMRIRTTTRERPRRTPPPTLRTQSSPTMPFSPIDYQKRARRTHGSQGLFHPRDYP